MLQRLRAELRAIQEWDRKGFVITTAIEALAVPIREARKEELIVKIRQIVERN